MQPTFNGREQATAGPPYALLDGVLTKAECAALVARAEAAGFSPMALAYPPGYRNNDRLVWDDEGFSARLFRRIAARLPQTLGGARVVALNPRFRVCRYTAGQSFTRHQDGAFEPTPERRSLLTCQLSLSEPHEFGGGHTRFFSGRTGALYASVRPRRGDAILFRHDTWHDGEPVSHGTKIVLRTDVVYDGVPGRTTTDARTLGHHAGYVFAATPLASGHVATASRDRTVRLFDARERRQVAVVGGHEASVTCLAEALPGVLISGSRDGTTRVLDARCGAPSESHRHLAFGSAVLALCRLGGGAFAVGAADGTVRRCHASNGDATLLAAHEGWVWALARLRGLVASGAEDGSLSLVSDHGDVRWRWAGPTPIRALAALDDDRLAVGFANGDVALFLVTQGGPELAVRTRVVGSGSVDALAPAEGGLVCGGEDGVVRRLDGRLRERSSVNLGSFVRAVAPLGGDRFVTGSYDGYARVVSLA